MADARGAAKIFRKIQRPRLSALFAKYEFSHHLGRLSTFPAMCTKAGRGSLIGDQQTPDVAPLCQRKYLREPVYSLIWPYAAFILDAACPMLYMCIALSGPLFL